MKFSLLALFALSCSHLLQAAELMPVAALYGREATPVRAVLSAPQLQLKATVKVAGQSKIKHARVYLQDLGTCEGSVNLCRDVLAIDLGPSPKPGQERMFQAEDLRKALDQEFPQHDISIQMSQRPRLVASMQPPDPALIRTLIEQKLQATEGALRFILLGLRLPVGLRLRHDNYAVQFPSWQQDLKFIQQNPRRSLVNIMVRMVDQEPGSTEQWDFNAQVMLRLEVQLAVVVKAMERGQALEQGSVVFQWMPYQENGIRDPEGLEKQLIRHSARPGQVLRSYDLTRDPDVKRGEKVEAFVEKNGVKMNSSAQAMESATVGQRIRIQLDTSKRQVMATVTGRSQVEVHMP